MSPVTRERRFDATALLAFSRRAQHRAVPQPASGPLPGSSPPATASGCRGNPVAVRERRGDPAAPRESVSRRLGERQIEGDVRRRGEFHRETQAVLTTQEEERLAADLQGAMPPGEILGRLRVSQTLRAQRLFGGGQRIGPGGLLDHAVTRGGAAPSTVLCNAAISQL